MSKKKYDRLKKIKSPVLIEILTKSGKVDRYRVLYPSGYCCYRMNTDFEDFTEKEIREATIKGGFNGVRNIRKIMLSSCFLPDYSFFYPTIAYAKRHKRRLHETVDAMRKYDGKYLKIGFILKT